MYDSYFGWVYILWFWASLGVGVSDYWASDVCIYSFPETVGYGGAGERARRRRRPPCERGLSVHETYQIKSDDDDGGEQIVFRGDLHKTGRNLAALFMVYAQRKITNARKSPHDMLCLHAFWLPRRLTAWAYVCVCVCVSYFPTFLLRTIFFFLWCAHCGLMVDILNKWWWQHSVNPIKGRYQNCKLTRKYRLNRFCSCNVLSGRWTRSRSTLPPSARTRTKNARGQTPSETRLRWPCTWIKIYIFIMYSRVRFSHVFISSHNSSI